MTEMSRASTDDRRAEDPRQCRHIRLSNPAGPGNRDYPRLLRAVADLLERIGDDIELLDLGLREDEHPDGLWTSVNIYYRRPPPRRPVWEPDSA